MILQALTDYYELLAGQGRIGRPGWSNIKISWALEINADGQLVSVLPLKHPSENGKKLIPREMELPSSRRHSSDITSNFLWDNVAYFLGYDKDKPERAKERFISAKEFHLGFFKSTDTESAKAIINFFRNWDPREVENNSILINNHEILTDGGNVTFYYNGKMVADDPTIRESWNKAFADESKGEKMRCLVTGHLAIPELVHPKIKARYVNKKIAIDPSFVSFNEDSFCSFGREQSANAPISKYAAFAYTSAMNYLLADKEHARLIGETIIVYWTKSGDERYQDIFAALLDGNNNHVTDEDLNSLMDAVANGKPYNFEGFPIAPENEFYILGVSTNVARLSVRFFWHSNFGTIIANLKKHYDDINIVTDNRNKWLNIPLWALLRETINEKSNDKNPLPQLAGDVMRSMISGTRYPETFMNQTMLRIRAEREITRGRAGIIKAYLIRNTGDYMNNMIREVTTVSLNTESNYTPYVLGRLFAVLEKVQKEANPEINATIKDRFFNSACATPGAVFPILLKLSNSHLKKLDTGKTINWSKQIGELSERLDMQFPTHLLLQEQGAFILGYYHQTQKFYEKKTKETEEK